VDLKAQFERWDFSEKKCCFKRRILIEKPYIVCMSNLLVMRIDFDYEKAPSLGSSQ
jgi:hypothetical protein